MRMGNRGGPRAVGRVFRAAAAALLLAGWALPLVALGADPPPDPDTACAKEKSFKSTAGVTMATLTVINNTDQPVQTFWLDYTGKRVFYERLAAHKQYKQPTWLTHPWIVASLEGACYRLAVMTSLEQTVTLNPGTGAAVASVEPAASATTSAPPIATPQPILTPAPFPTAGAFATVAPLPDPGLSSGTGLTPPDNTMPLILGAGALAAIGAAVAAYWAAHTGKAWWGTDDPSPVKAPEPAPPPAPAPELHYTDNYFDQYGRPIANEQVAAYQEAIAAWEAAGSHGPVPKAPLGNADLPVNDLVAQHEAERRTALARDSAPALFIKDTNGKFYDPFGRPIPRPQIDAFYKGLEYWEASGREGTYPTIPTGDPNRPVSESILKLQADRAARAANERDPAYVQVIFPKP